MTFRDLLPGQQFVFVDAKGETVPRWGSLGPFVKLGAGTYCRPTDYVRGREFPVERTSQNAKVRTAKQEAEHV